MTIKQDIEREAERLGTAVRAAAEEFARVTGLRPDINVNWLMHQPLSGRASSLKLTRVTVEVGGLSVEA